MMVALKIRIIPINDGSVILSLRINAEKSVAKTGSKAKMMLASLGGMTFCAFTWTVSPNADARIPKYNTALMPLPGSIRVPLKPAKTKQTAATKSDCTVTKPIGSTLGFEPI